MNLQRHLSLMRRSKKDPRLKSRTFYAQANLLAGGLLSNWGPFQTNMKEFYDRSGRA